MVPSCLSGSIGGCGGGGIRCNGHKSSKTDHPTHLKAPLCQAAAAKYTSSAANDVAAATSVAAPAAPAACAATVAIHTTSSAAAHAAASAAAATKSPQQPQQFAPLSPQKPARPFEQQLRLPPQQQKPELEPAVPSQQLALPPPPPPPLIPSPLPQAKPEAALTRTVQTEIRGEPLATAALQSPSNRTQRPPQLPRIATPPESPKVTKAPYTMPPLLMTRETKTISVQPPAPNHDTESETNSAPPKTFVVASEETMPRIQPINKIELDPETKYPPPYQPKEFYVSPDEKSTSKIQPPPDPEPEPETKSLQFPQPKTYSFTSEKKTSIDGHGSRPNNVYCDKLQGPLTETKEDSKLRIIMAGDNTGAVMEVYCIHSRGLAHRHTGAKFQGDDNGHGRKIDQEYAVKEKTNKTATKTKHLSAVVNSNVQGINSSIVVNSSCIQHSPGIHITSTSCCQPENKVSSYRKGRRPHLH